MIRFLILILFSLFFPIQNSSAVSPSLEETIDFLVQGERSTVECKHVTLPDCETKMKIKWSIDDNCVLKLYRPFMQTNMGERDEINQIIYLNKINLKKGVKWKKLAGSELGFVLFGKDVTDDIKKKDLYNKWNWKNYVKSDRNLKAIQHLFGNFCEGAKSAF